MTLGPVNSQSSYLGPEFDLPKDMEGIRDFMNKRERLTATILNVKENANYEKRELLSAQQWFSNINGGAIKTSYGYRLTFDLVSLNGGSIATGGTTNIAIPTNPAVNTPTTIQYANGLIPLHGFGAATGGTTYYFINDPNLYVRFVNTSPTVQTIQVTNTTGTALTQCYFCFEYLKV